MKILCASTALLLLALGSGCGGPSAGTATARRSGGDATRLTTEAGEAWGALDPARAARLAEAAMSAGAGDEAREIAARARLALGQPERAAQALAGVSDPELLHLRASAQIAAGDFAGAAETLETATARPHEEDPWTDAMLPAVRAARDAEAPYRMSGSGDATLPLEALPLPVVRVRVDALETLAVVGTGAFLTVLDPRVRAGAGTIDELRLGGLVVHDVPHTVRSLDPVREALGVEIGMVIGADLLMRTYATLDGPNARLVLHAEAPIRADTNTAPLLTPTGSFVALVATIGDAPAWLTVDTAGLFPIALAPGAEEALGLTGVEWTSGPGTASFTVAGRVRLGSLEIEGIPLVRGLLDEGHARAVGAPVAGSVGWGLLGQLAVSFDPRARRLRFE